jgi:putative FmdB family regulatory protein
MIYVYKCPDCQMEMEVIKHLAEIDNPEFCQNCGTECFKKMCAPAGFINASFWRTEQGQFNPAFGCEVKSLKHKRDLMKQHNCVEVGGETKESMYRHTELKAEKEREKSYSDITKKLLG